MKSKIAEAIKLKDEAIAIIRTDERPEDSILRGKGERSCLIAFLAAAARGKTNAFSLETTGCPGGRAGLGFCRIPEATKYFLSVGIEGKREGEFYKKTPGLAGEYIDNMVLPTAKSYVIFKPLSELREDEKPEVIVFLVNADQLSALVTLANYDRGSQDNVRLESGAGCAQAILYAIQEENSNGKCTVGLTDLSARKVIQKDLLSFSIPYRRFSEMEESVENSFLSKETWNYLKERA